MPLVPSTGRVRPSTRKSKWENTMVDLVWSRKILRLFVLTLTDGRTGHLLATRRGEQDIAVLKVRHTASAHGAGSEFSAKRQPIVMARMRHLG
jgi:hypothetical protein